MGIIQELSKSHWGFWSRWDVIDVVPGWCRRTKQDAYILRDNCTKQLFVAFYGRKDQWIAKPLNKRWGMPPKRYFNRVDGKEIYLMEGMFTDLRIEQSGNTCWRTNPSAHVAKGNTTWKFFHAHTEQASLWLALSDLRTPFAGEIGLWNEIEGQRIDDDGGSMYTTITRVNPTPQGYEFFTKKGKVCHTIWDTDKEGEQEYYDLYFDDVMPFDSPNNLFKVFLRNFAFGKYENNPKTVIKQIPNSLDENLKILYGYLQGGQNDNKPPAT